MITLLFVSYQHRIHLMLWCKSSSPSINKSCKLNHHRAFNMHTSRLWQATPSMFTSWPSLQMGLASPLGLGTTPSDSGRQPMALSSRRWQATPTQFSPWPSPQTGLASPLGLMTTLSDSGCQPLALSSRRWQATPIWFSPWPSPQMGLASPLGLPTTLSDSGHQPPVLSTSLDNSGTMLKK
jgi:hypothetical protein